MIVLCVRYRTYAAAIALVRHPSDFCGDWHSGPELAGRQKHWRGRRSERVIDIGMQHYQ